MWLIRQWQKQSGKKLQTPNIINFDSFLVDFFLRCGHTISVTVFDLSYTSMSDYFLLLASICSVSVQCYGFCFLLTSTTKIRPHYKLARTSLTGEQRHNCHHPRETLLFEVIFTHPSSVYICTTTIVFYVCGYLFLALLVRIQQT